jgi:hypothetical protein
MKSGFWITSVFVVNLLCGCGQITTSSPHGEKVQSDNHDHDHDATSTAKSDHDHSGWWCSEHGVPEAVCSQCSPKNAAEFQKTGDWCAEHDCAKSQCFKCDPGLKEKFATQYRAKFGKEPPVAEGDHAEIDSKKS